jgi:ABC-type multidrug transport system ATPase subunit
MIVYDVQDLHKTYPGQETPANKGIDLQIRQGEIFGILGDNGAGKTTLVRQMVNLLRPSSGRIELFGRSVSDNPLHVPLNVGYMPQETHALNNLTVGEAIYFTAHLRGLTRIEARRERDEQLDMWQIGPLRDRSSSRLSGGQRRLLRLAVAMAAALPVLILDEPTNDLAPQRRRLVWDVLTRVSREHGTTILFITHDAIEAEKVIQRVGIMREGTLVAVGRPSELKKTVDRKLRLELFCEPGATPRLPAGIEMYALGPGRWIAWVDRSEVERVIGHLDVEQLDDFRLYSATLEDLYVHYAT